MNSCWRKSDGGPILVIEQIHKMELKKSSPGQPRDSYPSVLKKKKQGEEKHLRSKLVRIF